jgi:hypothetical protein
MGEIVVPTLLDADPEELADHLLAAGFTSSMWAEDDGLHILTDADASAAVASFVKGKTVDRSDPNSPFHIAPLPEYLRTHVVHMRDYRNAVRNNQAVTNAQTTHVIADIIDALRFINAKATGD